MESLFNQLSAQEQLLSRLLVEGQAALNAIKQLPEKGSSEVLVPIGGNVHIRVNCPPPSKVLVGIGAQVVVEKSRSEAEEYLNERIKELSDALNNVRGQMADLSNRINAARQELGRLVQQAQQAQQAQGT
jgi:prefoldin alpha subunit